MYFLYVLNIFYLIAILEIFWYKCSLAAQIREVANFVIEAANYLPYLKLPSIYLKLPIFDGILLKLLILFIVQIYSIYALLRGVLYLS